MAAPKPSMPAFEHFTFGMFDENLDLVADIDDFLSARWIRRWRQPGEFEIKLSIYNNDAKQTSRSWEDWEYVNLYRGGVSRLGKIELAEFKMEPGGTPPEVLTLSGTDGAGILRQRIPFVGVTAGTGFDTVTATPAETAMKHFVDGNMISATDTLRNFTGLALETDSGRGGNVSYSARLEDGIDKVVEAICLASPSSVGFDVIFNPDPDSKARTFRTLVGTDRSATVQFNVRLGNVGPFTYRRDLTQMKNLAYVSDGGEAAAAVFATMPLADVPAGDARYEIYVDGSDTTTTAELQEAGTAALAEQGVSEAVEFEIVPDNSFHYMSRDAAGDYDLGDIISALYYDKNDHLIVNAAARIIEVTEEYGTSPLQETITLGMGTTIQDTKQYIRRMRKQLGVRSRA